MQTLAWILLLTGGLLIRQVTAGRAGNTLEDFSDGFTAFVSGDWTGLSAVAARRGSNNEVVSVPSVTETPITVGGSPVVGGNGGTELITEMRKLATAANNRYILGTQGPNSYDCSGLVWRAMRNIGAYKGVRFTTATFPFMAGSAVTQVPNPQVGDIVLWAKTAGRAFGHMGVVIGQDRMFSALSSSWGIRESPISAEKGTPSYWRLK